MIKTTFISHSRLLKVKTCDGTYERRIGGCTDAQADIVVLVVAEIDDILSSHYAKAPSTMWERLLYVIGVGNGR